MQDLATSDFATFDEAYAQALTQQGSVAVADEVLGDKFTVLPSEFKGQLVGVPLLLMSWSFRDGNKGEYVSVRLVARNEDGSARRLVINDGSTGVFRQLQELERSTGRTGGLLVKRGLRESTYSFNGQNGIQQGSTFYLNTDA